MEKIKVGSDFSGVGAFDQALLRLKIPHQTVFSCDMDRFARQTYIHNYGTEEDKKLAGENYKDVMQSGFSFYYPMNVYDRQIPEEPLDIYVSSPPCQSFSLAGKRKGEDDERGILFYNTHEFIQKNKPRYFIIENVKGLLSDDSGKTFQRWLDYLGGKSVNGNPVIFPLDESTPYHVYWQVLNAKDYGIPQNRERIFIVGIRDDDDNNFTFPKPFHLTKRLKDVLEPEVDEKYFLSDKMINYFHTRADNFNNGKINYKDGDSVASTITAHSKSLDISDNIIKCVGNANPSGNGMNGNVFDEEGISPTITTNKGEGIKIKSATKADEKPEPIIGAFRGRNPQNPNDRTTGAPTEQRLEINQNGTSNAITTVQKDNVVVTKNYIQWDTSGKGHASQQDRAYFEDGYMCTVPAARTENECNILLKDYKIRRLTPREAFRLMDFPDTFTWPVSDSQAYKQAGNSICVGVLCEILKKLKLD